MLRALTFIHNARDSNLTIAGVSTNAPPEPMKPLTNPPNKAYREKKNDIGKIEIDEVQA